MEGLNGAMGGVNLREDVYGTPDAGLWASAPQVRLLELHTLFLYFFTWANARIDTRYYFILKRLAQQQLLC